VDRHRGSGPIDEQLLSRSVVLPEGDVPISAPALVEFAEAADMCCNTCQPLCGGRIYVAR
jgi:hypothetical protein